MLSPERALLTRAQRDWLLPVVAEFYLELSAESRDEDLLHCAFDFCSRTRGHAGAAHIRAAIERALGAREGGEQ